MPFTVRQLPAGFDVTATRMPAALEAAGIQPVGRELRTVRRLQDTVRRLITCLRPNRRRGCDRRVSPLSFDQHGLAQAPGRHAQSINNCTKEGMPCERVGRFRRCDFVARYAHLGAGREAHPAQGGTE